MPKFNEEQLELAIVNMFVSEGWQHIDGRYLHRKYEEVLMEEDIKAYLLLKYKNEALTEKEIAGIIENIKLLPSRPLYDGAKQTYELLNLGFNIARENTSKQNLHIQLIDFAEPTNNTYKVVNQYYVQGDKLRRPDVLLFINGIPIVIIEFKTAIEEDTTIHDAWKQLHNRYCRDISNLLKYTTLSVISDGANSKLASIFTPYEYYYAWRKVTGDEKPSEGVASLKTMIKGAFTPTRLLQILDDFVYYPDNSAKDEAIVCRYPQFFATQKMLENIKTNIKPFGEGKGGTYFGATGCGKTFTMLFLARHLTRKHIEVFNNPTIIIIEDREDLDTQTSKLFVNSKSYLRDDKVKSIEDREELKTVLGSCESGGVYITTIQKFCENIGLLSDRKNIICISDEAHRTQTNTGSKLVVTEDGVKKTYGFAKYLRDSFPNATYVGFTGTPIDETISVFGKIVDYYTMKESCADEITVKLTYEPRLARVIVNDEQAKVIEQYYQQCLVEGTNEYQVEASKKAMTEMKRVLGDPDRLRKLAKDIVIHYENLCSQKPEVVQKAMIICSDRLIAYNLYNEIIKLKPTWNKAIRSEKEKELSREKLEKLLPLERIKLIATRDKDDPKEMYDLLGAKEYRAKLDEQFKDDNSNFKIAIVVDMWITGFDVPSLAVMYIDKPIQKHTLIQTISRANRTYPGKDRGLIVDYIGIRDEMFTALKKYNDEDADDLIDELDITLAIFRNHLELVRNLFCKFNSEKFYTGSPLERLQCLSRAAEYVQLQKEFERRFMDLSKKLKAAYEISFPSGSLEEKEVNEAQFYLAIRSIIYKQTKGETPDIEVMNSYVEKMIDKAIACTGVENILNVDKPEDLYGEEFEKQLDEIKLPITKFNALIKLMRKAISEYGKVNRLKAVEFDEKLRGVVARYNDRDKLVFTSEVVADFVNSLSDEVIKMFNELQEDKSAFKDMGITFEEKAFYDILVKVRNEHKFIYADEKCIVLAKEIKELVDEKSLYTDWAVRDDIKNKLSRDLTVLLYKNGYPPEWDDEVFEQVMQQAENFKKFN